MQVQLAHKQFALHSDPGVRKNNEDFCGYELSRDLTSALLVLADGMGGHACGEVASQIAIDTLLKSFQRARGFDDPEERLRTAICDAHGRILHEASADSSRMGMGTTIVGVLVRPGDLTVAHVGDSRALQFRSAYVRRLTRDHLYVVDVLGLEEQIAKSHPNGNVLAQALGAQQRVQPTISQFDVASGDFIVLCSDGVSEYVTEQEMSAALAAASLKEAVVRMVQMALDKGSHDNCTVAALAIP